MDSNHKDLFYTTKLKLHIQKVTIILFTKQSVHQYIYIIYVHMLHSETIIYNKWLYS